MNYNAKTKYFENIPLLQNTLLSYFCEPESLKYINKQFFELNYEKYNTHIKPHSIIVTYYPDTKIIKERKTYKNGVQHGLYEEYYENGGLSKKCIFRDGKLNGLSEEWYSDGRPYSEANYKNGNLHGLQKKYNGFGACFISNYKNGKEMY